MQPRPQPRPPKGIKTIIWHFPRGAFAIEDYQQNACRKALSMRAKWVKVINWKEQDPFDGSAQLLFDIEILRKGR